jgi:S1-C subfamily serine protease
MRAESGFSGGPVLNSADEAVGMLAAGDTSNSAIIPSKYLRGFLKRLDGPVKPVPISDAAENLGTTTQALWARIDARELSVIEHPELGFLIYL